MLDPCSPCCCPGAPCEHCMFGYRSKEENHASMKELITKLVTGENPYGCGAAKTYMTYHKDWRKEIDIPIPDIEAIRERIGGTNVEKSEKCVKELKDAIRKVYFNNLETANNYNRMSSEAEKEGLTLYAYEYAIAARTLFDANEDMRNVFEKSDFRDIFRNED